MTLSRIYKYELIIKKDEAEVELPSFHQILSIQNQNGILCLWAKVNTDPNVKKIKKKFIIKNTGQDADDLAYDSYITTVQIGGFVKHIFDADIKENKK